jgi:hypothetical protein
MIGSAKVAATLAVAAASGAAAMLLASLVLVTPASAEPIRECGNYVFTDTNRGFWTYLTIPGYTPVYNLTTRNVSCANARPFALLVAGYWPGVRYRNGFRCVNRLFYGEDWDTRCTRGAQVIHWQGGAS